MEKYTSAELDVVALTNAETVSTSSTVAPGENELPIDPSPNNTDTVYTMA